MKTTLQKLLKLLLPLLFGCGIVWFISKDVDVEAVVAVVSQGLHWGWVWVSLVFALLSHVLRGLRWRLQLRTLGVNPSAHDMALSVFGNYGLNLVLPRLGELWRCNYVAQRTGLSFVKTVGSMIGERAVDMLCAGTMAVAAFLLESDLFFRFFDNTGDFGDKVFRMATSPWLWSGVALLIALFLALRFVRRGRKVIDVVKGFVSRLWQGVMSLRSLPSPAAYVWYSIAIWAAYYLNSYTSLFFLDCTSHLSPLAGLFIFVVGSLSLLVPVQGGLGAWHAAVIWALGCYGIGGVEAFSFVMVSWAIEQGFVLLLGLYALLYVSLRRRQAADSPKETQCASIEEAN